MKKLVTICAVMMIAAIPAMAEVTLSGNAATDGWNRIGNSRDLGIWADNSSTTADFDLYTTSFILPEALSPAERAYTDFAGVDSTFKAGDKIYGIGVNWLGTQRGGSYTFINVDPTGASGWQAASTVGGGDGNTSSSAADGNFRVNPSPASQNGFYGDPYGVWVSGEETIPYGNNITSNTFDISTLPVRSLGLNDSSGWTSWQYLFNESAMQRAGTGESIFTDDWKFTLTTGSTTSQWTGIVANGAGTTAAPVPVPGAFLLGGIGVSCVSWLRRRKNL